MLGYGSNLWESEKWARECLDSGSETRIKDTLVYSQKPHHRQEAIEKLLAKPLESVLELEWIMSHAHLHERGNVWEMIKSCKESPCVSLLAKAFSALSSDEYEKQQREAWDMIVERLQRPDHKLSIQTLDFLLSVSEKRPKYREEASRLIVGFGYDPATLGEKIKEWYHPESQI